MVCNQLAERLQYQAKQKAYQQWYLVSNLTEHGAGLNPEDEMAELVKHFTLGVGYIGLCETLRALCGKDQTDPVGAKLGLEVINFFKQEVVKLANEKQINLTVLATPAEGLASRFVKLDKVRYGELKGITDHGYYTNSHQLPMDYTGSMKKKIELEAPYHSLATAGHILRLEFDGDPSVNLPAVEKAILFSFEQNAGYVGINHNDNYCESCTTNFKSRDTKKCPKCGSEDITVISTITGYLSAKTKKWNEGKKNELKHRKGQELDF